MSPAGGARRGAALAAGVLLAVVVAAALPQAPNYDTALHLLWARELWDGNAPAVDAAAASTMHPLWLLLSLLVIPFGAPLAIEAMQLLAVAGFGFVVAAAWRLADAIAGRVAAAVAAIAVASSFALLLLTYKSYVDVPFVALILWALVLERAWQPPAEAGLREAASRSPSAAERFAPLGVPALLLLAGLLRPEGWAFGLLLVASRLPRGAELRTLLGPALLVLAAPLIWMLTDLALSGNPLQSLTGTRELAEELGRPTGLARAPRELAVLLADLARPPIAGAGLAGVVLTAWAGRWRQPATGLPLLVLGAACAGFLLVGALGLPLLQRYLLIAGVLVCVFAGVAAAVIVALATGRGDPRAAAEVRELGVALDPEAGDPRVPGGSSAARLTPGWLRAGAVAALVLGVFGGAGYLVLKAGSFATVARGALREAEWQRDAAELVAQPAVRAAARCGPITLPTYRLIPELTLRAELPIDAVASRATTLGGIGPQPAGAAIVIEGDRKARTRLAYAAGVDRATNTPPAGFSEVARLTPFVAYGRC